jgi:hypothetical protein
VRHRCWEETILETADVEAMVFEEFFFAARLQMHPHPTLMEILLEFWV